MNKTILISGASRGIGKAIAIELAKHSYNLIITCKNSESSLQELCNNIVSTYKVDCFPFIGDMSNPQDVASLFKALDKDNIQVNILINNAGVSYVGLLQDMSFEEWNTVINTNLTSVFNLSKNSIPNMIHNGCGKIINISSVWGCVGASCETAYSASKGGMNAFTKALAKELAPSNISVNAIACGIIDTDMNSCFTEAEKQQISDEIPVGRMGTVDEVAQMVLNLINAPLYLTGQIIKLDGGWI